MIWGEQSMGQPRSSPRSTASRCRIKHGNRGFEPPAPGSGVVHGGGSRNCRLSAVGDEWIDVIGWASQEYAGQIAGVSHESEHDLAVMVRDFLENGSGAGRSVYSSDSDSGTPELNHLAEKISFFRHTVDQYEHDLSSVVHSLLLSLSEINLHLGKDGSCNSSCIRRCLVRLLRVSGYDAGLCVSKWQGSEKVPGGEHQYIDVVHGGGSTTSHERTIIDVDFRSHFQIARAVESFDAILKSLPVIYVGSWPRLRQFLQVMVEAAKHSLKQNSMPLPPWRSLAYMQAKWQSKYERKINLDSASIQNTGFCGSTQCVGHLRHLKASLQSELEKERLLKSITDDGVLRFKAPERRRIRTLISM